MEGGARLFPKEVNGCYGGLEVADAKMAAAYFCLACVAQGATLVATEPISSGARLSPANRMALISSDQFPMRPCFEMRLGFGGSLVLAFVLLAVSAVAPLK